MREIHVGDTLDQYTLTELLAKSGMASIYKAIDNADGGVVALKVPHLQLESDVVFFERFKREEKIGQRLEHPNLIKILQPRDKSRMYLAMEFVDGKSLRARMNEEKRMPAAQAVPIVKEIAQALSYMHAQGVVHRDIKPENVLVTPEHGVKILDFGIALDDSARRLTWFKLSNAMGTPDYMAPEQIGGRRGDARTDVYALGTILYEMLTGHLPYSAANPHSLVRAKTSEDPRPPSIFVPGIDAGLEAVILKALARAPRERHQSMAELVAELEDPSTALGREGREGSEGSERAPSGRRVRVSRRWRTSLSIAAILVALGTLVWLSSRHATRPGASDDAPAPRSQIE